MLIINFVRGDDEKNGREYFDLNGFYFLLDEKIHVYSIILL